MLSWTPSTSSCEDMKVEIIVFVCSDRSQAGKMEANFYKYKT